MRAARGDGMREVFYSNARQLQYLRSQGCDQIQGYGLGCLLRPVDFENWLRLRGSIYAKSSESLATA